MSTTVRIAKMQQDIAEWEGISSKCRQAYLDSKLYWNVNDPEIVAFLLAEGANPNAAQYRHCVDVLHRAVLTAGDAELEVVRMLLQAGANPNFRERGYGETALFSCRKPEVARLLVEHGASLGVRSHRGLNAVESWEEIERDDNVDMRALIDAVDPIKDAIEIERLGYSTRCKYFSSTGEQDGVMDMLRVSFYKNGQVAFSIENKNDPIAIHRRALAIIKDQVGA